MDIGSSSIYVRQPGVVRVGASIYPPLMMYVYLPESYGIKYGNTFPRRSQAFLRDDDRMRELCQRTVSHPRELYADVKMEVVDPISTARAAGQS